MTRKELERHKDKLMQSLIQVEPIYYATPTISGKTLTLERIFAYELYHQLRNSYEYEQPYAINGEISKGISFCSGNETTVFPDLVIHQHGTTEGNAVAIEIKTDKDVSPSDLIHDLKKLKKYTDEGNLNYQLGILLIANLDFCSKLNSMRNEEEKQQILSLLNSPRIAVWNKFKKIDGSSEWIKIENISEDEL